MSHYRPPPLGSDYNPRLVLQLRKDPEGGDLLPSVVAIEAVAVNARELLILVHGFNNHQGEARAAYQAFRVRARRLAGRARIGPLEDQLADAYWPGDAKWPGIADRLDAVVYPRAVATARDAGPKLAAYLATKPGLLIVHFVSHSLGGRVVLETIERLRGRGGPRIGKVCLMAAAVPTYMLFPGGALHDAAAEPAFLRVLFSESDLALRATFGVGQTFAGEGVLPQAVGLRGDIPISPGRMERERIAGAGHGDYWGGQDNLATKRSGEAVAGFFGFEAVATRGLSSRPLPPKTEVPSRALSSRREIAGQA